MLVGQTGADTDFDTAEETGGAKTHALTAAEMPAHTHVQDAHTHVQNSHTHTVPMQGSATPATSGTHIVNSTATGGSSRNSADGGAAAATAVNQNATAVNQNAGGGGAHNNLPPYLVVYVWKRTA